MSAASVVESGNVSLSTKESTAESVVCDTCGVVAHTNYEKKTKAEMLRRSLCFDCLFWDGLVQIKDEPYVVRVKGCHYQIGPNDDTPREWRGFGGARFNIEFKDGRYATTSNLWCQGDIPERFRHLLPDNARFGP